MTFPEAILALSRSPELSVLFKATMLLILAIAAAQTAVRARAAVRHLIFASAFVALAALPLVMSTTPGVRVGIAVKPSIATPAVTAPPVAPAFHPSAAAPGAAPTWALPSW